MSEEGKKIVDFYKDLTQINQVKYFPINIDKDFPRWNNGKLMIDFYYSDIRYKQAKTETDNQLTWFYKNYPGFLSDKAAQKSKIDYQQNLVNSLQQAIKQDKDKIEALS